MRDTDQSPERYLAIYQKDHPSLERAHQATRNGLEPAQFEQKRTKINHLLEALSLAAAPYKVSTLGRRPKTRHGLSLPPDRIVLPLR